MSTETIEKQKVNFKEINLSDITPSPFNYRKDFDADSMNELAESIASKGVLQPIIVRQNGKAGKYELVCGERRYRASKIAERLTIPCIIRELKDDEVMELQIIENLQRKDVHPMEEAVGFKHLIDKKQLDIKSIAQRVGKSPQYVAGRLKLNDLTPDFQKAFFKDLLSLEDAMAICTISAIDQKEMWKDSDFSDDFKNGSEFDINTWTLNKYRNNLANAPFDITDPLLKKDMGACLSCQFNTANSLLFPGDSGKSLCMNSQCFKQKTNLSFDVYLKQAKDSPEMILVSSDYRMPEADKLVNQVMKDGINVLSEKDYDYEEMPEPPDPNDYTIDDYDSQKEADENYKEAMEEYNKELAGYNKQVSSGKLIKAFVIHGDDKGKFRYISMKKKVANTESKKKIDADTFTEADIKNEIKRIRERESRSKQLDMEKVQLEINKALEQHSKLKAPGLKHQGKVDRALMAYIIINESSDWGLRGLIKKHFKIHNPGGNYNYQFDYFKQLEKITDDQLAFIVRHILIKKYCNANLIYGIYSNQGALYLLAEYLGIDLKKIQAAQNEIAKKRQERIAERITKLNEQIKEKKKK